VRDRGAREEGRPTRAGGGAGRGRPRLRQLRHGKAAACKEMGILEETVHLPKDTLREAAGAGREGSTPTRSSTHTGPAAPARAHRFQQGAFAHRPDKDVDGLHPMNVGRLTAGEPVFLPCTPAGNPAALGAHRPRPRREARGHLRPPPTSSASRSRPCLSRRQGRQRHVTVCHTGTRDMGRLTRQATS